MAEYGKVLTDLSNPDYWEKETEGHEVTTRVAATGTDKRRSSVLCAARSSWEGQGILRLPSGEDG
eukprot:760514-Hanusia_phi.AAC.3